MTAPAHLIAYCSRSTIAPDAFAQELEAIVQTAQQENPKFNTTGVLFFHEGMFLQVLEGEAQHLRQLMENIGKDTRHSEVEVLIDEPISQRSFGAWNMDSFELDASTRIDHATLKNIAEEYRINLVPRGDVFVKFYKAMLTHNR